MKHTKLIYHSLHKRPMPGCLPLFFLLAALVVAGVISLVEVRLPQPLRPRGIGAMYYKDDELTRFQVRQRSALPLRLPTYADPATRLPIAKHDLPLLREVTLEPAPPSTFSTEAPDSAVLRADILLELPPEEQKPEPDHGEEVQP